MPTPIPFDTASIDAEGFSGRVVKDRRDEQLEAAADGLRTQVGAR